MRRIVALALSAICISPLFSCSKSRIAELQGYPLNQIQGVIERNNVAIDKEIKAEGSGSLRVSATFPTVVHLFETGAIDIDEARLIYKAKLRSEDLKGKAYLEMLVDLPQGEFFSRGIESALSGTTGWTTESIPFYLEKGQRPMNVKLNLVVDGTGTVWIDDVKLLKTPLQ